MLACDCRVASAATAQFGDVLAFMFYVLQTRCLGEKGPPEESVGCLHAVTSLRVA